MSNYSHAGMASTTGATDAMQGHRHWCLDDLDWACIDHEAIKYNEDMFYLLMSASFVETGSDTYAANLAEQYAEHAEICAWLQEHWEAEELQHGAALRRYVEAVWPAFPWQEAYDSFFAEYSRLCTTEDLYDDCRLEMVARCVVETGTTAYYQTLRGLSDEPVLRELLGCIRNDEVGHYKHFLKYFRQLQQYRPVGRVQVAGVLYRRLKELRDSDSDVALRHVWAHRGDIFAHGASSFAEVARRIYHLVSDRLPADQSIRMLLKPLELPPRIEHMVQAPLARLAIRVMAA